MVTNHYAVMGIQDFARGSEAKRAYHRLALVWHPDRQVNASEQRQKEAEDVFKVSQPPRSQVLLDNALIKQH